MSHGSIVWAHGQTLKVLTAPGESEMHFEVCRADGRGVCTPQGSIHATALLDEDFKEGKKVECELLVEDGFVPPGACLVADFIKTRQPAQHGSCKKGGLTWAPHVEETRQFTGDRGARRNTPFLPANPSAQEERSSTQSRCSDELRPLGSTRRSAEGGVGPSELDANRLSRPISMQLDLSETQGTFAKPLSEEVPRESRARVSGAQAVVDPPASNGPAAPAAPWDAVSSSQDDLHDEEPSRRRSSSQRWRVFHGQEKDSWRDPLRSSKSPAPQDASRTSKLKQHSSADARPVDHKPVQMQVDASEGSLFRDDALAPTRVSQQGPAGAVGSHPCRESGSVGADARQSRASRLSAAAPTRHTSMVIEAASDQGSADIPTAGSERASQTSSRSSYFSAGSRGSQSSHPSRTQGHMHGRPSAHSFRASESRGSRLSNRSSRSQAQTHLQHFTCRYTEPQSVTFSGLRQEPCIIDSRYAEGLMGRDRTTLLVLLEQAEHSVSAVRRQKSAADAATMPRVLARLSAEFVLHARHAREVRGGQLPNLQTICEEPVLPVVLQRLVEVLDTLVPVEESTTDAELAFAAPEVYVMGGEASVQYTESVLESLRQAFGPHGFIPECMSYLGRRRSFKKELQERNLENFTDQMEILTLLAIRLALEWETPGTVPRPLDIATQQDGFQAVLERMAELMKRLRCGSGKKTVRGILAQLALALETLLKMLRSDSGLELLCVTGFGTSP